jgi:beta-galactosidase
MASYTGRFGLMELQLGQVNWGGVPVLPYPGAVRLWLWTAFAHGAEFVTTYRFRQPLVGVELFHHGLVGTDGITNSTGGRQFIQVISELKRLNLSKVPPVAQEEHDPKATVGILFDFEQLWYFKTLPQAERWNQPLWLQRWHAAFARLGLKVKVIHPDRPWPKDLAVVTAPGLQMVDDTLAKRLDDYATAGGHLVLTCRSGLMDRNGRVFEGPTAAPLMPLVCASIEAYDGLPRGAVGHLEMDGKKYQWDVWGELLYAGDETKVLAKYADQFYAGAAAATRCRHGQGTVTYCGVFAEQAFIDALAEQVAKRAELRTVALPPRVHLLKRGPYRILLNYNDTPVTAPAPRGTTFLVGAATVEPAGVAVWAE